MRLARSYSSSKQQAKETIQAVLPELMDRFAGSVSNPKVDWHNDTAEFSGRVLMLNIQGTLRISDEELVLNVDGIPFWGQGKARRQIEMWLDENLPG